MRCGRRRLGVARAARRRARHPLAPARPPRSAPDRRRPARRAGRSCARGPRRPHRERSRAHAEPRRALRARVVRRALRGRPRSGAVVARSRTGRCSATGRTSSRAVRCSRPSGAVRTSRPSMCSRTRRCGRPSGATTSWWLTGRPDPGRDAEEAEAARRALRDDRGRWTDVLADARLARRERAARLRRRRPARDGQRRVLPRPPPRAPSAAARARGGADGARRRGVDARGDAPAGRRAVQRDHAQVVGPADGWCRRSSSGTASMARSSASRRSCAGSRAYVGLSQIEEHETDDPVEDLRRRLAHVRERLDAGDTFVFVHQKAIDAAGHTKDPHDQAARRSSGSTARSASCRSIARSCASPATTRRRPRPK